VVKLLSPALLLHKILEEREICNLFKK